ARESRAMHRFAAAGPEPEPHPLVLLMGEQRKRDVRRALGQLETSDRELLEMTYGQELTAEEIGRRLGLTVGNVRVRRHRAIRRLAELLGVTRASDRELKD